MVALMTPTLIGLGDWQLQRADWKAAMLADLEAAPSLPPVDLDAVAGTPVNFRRARATCRATAAAAQVVAGQNRAGASGYVYRFPCRDGVTAVIGWAVRPDVAVVPAAGEVTGQAIESERTILLYADRAPSPLVAAAPPSLATIPDNHRAYAMQWFAFAAVLLAIYAVYLWRLARH
jgi:cytochrome oxidase assembly protein ShyY1